MPRLTTQHYLLLHTWLAELWRDHQDVFSLVSLREQWYLHDYFVPSWEQAGEEELREHRTRVNAERPSLPQCAGRAVRQLHERLKATQEEAALVPAGGRGEPRRRKGRVVVSAVVNPQIDLERMSRALLRAAEKLAEADHDDSLAA